MFERQVLGEDYWAKQAATKPVLYPSGAPMADALVRGEISIGPLLYNALVSVDLFLAATTLLITIAMTVVGTFMSDLLLAALDPRISYS